MKNLVLRFGIYGALVSITLGLINWFTIAQAYPPMASKITGYLSITLAMMCIPLGMKYYRDKYNASLTFGNAFKLGMGINLVASTISFIYGVLFFALAGDSFNEWNRRGLSETELIALEARLAETPDFMLTPLFQGFVFFLMVLIIGLIINLMSALILKSE